MTLCKRVKNQWVTDLSGLFRIPFRVASEGPRREHLWVVVRLIAVTLRHYKALRSSVIKIGDHVEVAHDTGWQALHEAADKKEADKRGDPGGYFVSNGAAYMHTNEAYVVEEVTDSGQLRLRWFVPLVSPEDVRISTKQVRP